MDGGIGYEDNFKNDLPQTSDERHQKEVRAATLRFIQELRQQIIEIATQNGGRVKTGVVEVSTEPLIVLPENKYRKKAFVRNQGMLEIQVYAVNPDTQGPYLLYPREFTEVYGVDAIAISTVSGLSLVGYLES